MKRFALSWFLMLFALVAAAPGFAQLPQLDTLLKDLEGKHQFYGSVLVRKENDTLFQSAYGAHEPPYPTPRNSPDSVYYIAQCGELFSGVATMMAVDKGLMSVDAPIGTYVPAFKDKPGPRVRDLLSHSSGLVHRMIYTGDKPRTKAITTAMAAEDGLAFAPGSRSTYCPSDFDVLGCALEQVTGKPYRQLLEEWILAPLGLKRTGLGLFPEGNQDLAQIPRMNDWNYWLKLFPDGSLPTDMYSCPGDLAAFLDALASGRLVAKGTFDLMRAGQFPNGTRKVGLGCLVTQAGAVFNQGSLGGTSSDLGGYHALALHDPRYGLTIVLLANKWRPDPGGDAVDLVVPTVYASLGLAE